MARIVQGTRPDRLTWFRLILGGLILHCSGCNGVPSRGDIRTAAGTVLEQSGDVLEPAAVDATRTETGLTAPAGSVVQVAPDGAVSVQVTEPTPVRAAVVREVVTGPRSFAPPSPAEMAKGAGVRWFYILGAVSGLLAIVSAIRKHVLAAICFGVGAFGMPIVGNLASSSWAMVVAGITIAAGTVAFVAWHLIRLNPAAVAELRDEVKKRAERLSPQPG